MTATAYLVFELGGQLYGLAADAVREVTRVVQTVAIPASLPHVEGALDYRGEVIASLDIRRRFGVPVRPVELTDHLIIADDGRRTVALRVDRALDVTEIADTDVTPVTGTLPGVGPVSGVARTSDGLVLIHDLATFLSEAESQALALPLQDLAPGTPPS